MQALFESRAVYGAWLRRTTARHALRRPAWSASRVPVRRHARRSGTVAAFVMVRGWICALDTALSRAAYALVRSWHRAGERQRPAMLSIADSR